MIFAMRPNSPNAAPAEIQQLMADYTAAWNAQDPDALEALVTDSYHIYGPEYGGSTCSTTTWRVSEPP
jgi:hypothetical protein